MRGESLVGWEPSHTANFGHEPTRLHHKLDEWALASPRHLRWLVAHAPPAAIRVLRPAAAMTATTVALAPDQWLPDQWLGAGDEGFAPACGWLVCDAPEAVDARISAILEAMRIDIESHVGEATWQQRARLHIAAGDLSVPFVTLLAPRLLVVLRGRVRVSLESGPITLVAGDALAIPSEVEHDLTTLAPTNVVLAVERWTPFAVHRRNVLVADRFLQGRTFVSRFTSRHGPWANMAKSALATVLRLVVSQGAAGQPQWPSRVDVAAAPHRGSSGVDVGAASEPDASATMCRTRGTSAPTS